MNTTEHRPITNENVMSAIIHCSKCLEELPEGVSPMEYSRTQSGFTDVGLQVWCNRHECNVMHIDFDGMKFKANTTCKE